MFYLAFGDVNVMETKLHNSESIALSLVEPGWYSVTTGAIALPADAVIQWVCYH